MSWNLDAFIEVCHYGLLIQYRLSMIHGRLVLGNSWMSFGQAMIPGKCMARVLMWAISTGWTIIAPSCSYMYSSSISNLMPSPKYWTYLHSCRSIIFCNGTEESRMAALGKEQEQTRSRSSIVTTQILQLGTFYPAEPEHQVLYSEIMFIHSWCF